MNRLLSRLLAMFGLVSARRFAVVSRLVDDLRAESVGWKRKAGEAGARVKALEADGRQQGHRVEKLRTSMEKLQLRHDEMEKLRARLAEAERELVVAREHLMAIEVKLDILEGAANVLDIRTRAAIATERNARSASA